MSLIPQQYVEVFNAVSAALISSRIAKFLFYSFYRLDMIVNHKHNSRVRLKRRRLTPFDLDFCE